LADDDVLGVLVSANRPDTFQLLDDGDDERAAGTGIYRPAAVSRRRARRGRELYDRGGQAAGLDDPRTGGHDGRVLFRHAGVHSPGRRVLESWLRALYNAVVRGHHGRHVAIGARRVRPVRQLGGRHAPKVPARVRSGQIIGLVSFLHILQHVLLCARHIMALCSMHTRLHYYGIPRNKSRGIDQSKN